jgi:predicted dehydrogenase
MTGASSNLPPPSAIDKGAVQGDRVVFPPWRGDADRPGEPPPAPLPPERRIGFAIVGLGRLALEQILPAFAQSGQARAVALVSGSPEKMALVARQHGIAPGACHTYEDFDSLRDNPAVQAVYVVLPNAMHREFVLRAALAGKHVLCEKPMATSAADARDMIAACDKAGVHLMVAYRIQYQPHHLRAREMVRDGRFGRLVAFSAANVQTVHPTAAAQWRHKRALAGGGALPDIGLYCLNTARFVSGEEPQEVYAHLHSPAGDPRFAQVEETVSFMLRFPSGLVANCVASYGAREDKWQRLHFERATLEMPDAYEYQGQQLFVGERDGDGDGDGNGNGNGNGNGKARRELVLGHANQFTAELDHLAGCILQGHAPRTPGEEGLRDQLLMEAIYASAASGRPVSAS